ncbi:MAG: LysM peptidoglycan-binding domain-containing protein [Acidimicrobiia bacterium]|nr:LysM peptidoglycan-binding domain-containing protein [Acidimicrobiia bacterium]
MVRIQSGDWLSRIAQDHDTTVPRLVELNSIQNPDRIYAGDWLLVCERPAEQRAAIGALHEQPFLVPRYAQAWADAVQRQRPEWGTPAQERFLVAVSQFESTWCENLWNPRDAGWENGVQYLGSYGCVQIRVRADGAGVRNRGWLSEGFENQAAAAWAILEHQSFGAWGPTSGSRPKLPADQTCGGAQSRSQCERAWAIADAVL